MENDKGDGLKSSKNSSLSEFLALIEIEAQAISEASRKNTHDLKSERRKVDETVSRSRRILPPGVS